VGFFDKQSLPWCGTINQASENEEIKMSREEISIEEITQLHFCMEEASSFSCGRWRLEVTPVNSELRLAVLNFLRIFSLNCS